MYRRCVNRHDGRVRPTQPANPQPTPQPQTVSRDQLDGLVTVLDLVRTDQATTRPELGHRSGLGRTVITQRVQYLLDAGVLAEGSLAASSGGRAPRELRLRAEGGVILAAELGVTSINVGVTDLAGTVLDSRELAQNISEGPATVLARVCELFDAMLAESDPAVPVWGVGVGLPGPVEFTTGRPIAPPIMPGWDNYPVREEFASIYDAPVWVDNEVNTMSLGEFRAGAGRGDSDILYIKLGTGIGAGLISGERLHRGSQGCAGDIGHIVVSDDSAVVCRCGKTGCLEALAGGAALARDGEIAARDGTSPLLAQHLEQVGRVQGVDVTRAARHGDRTAVELLTTAGQRVGGVLATLVSFYNPSLVLIGGGVAGAGDLLLATIRESIYRRSLPLATRELRIERSTLNDRAGVTGAAFMVIDELFSRVRLARWLTGGTPACMPELASDTHAA